MAVSNRNRETKINIELSPNNLDLMLEYSLAENPLVNLRAINNLYKLIKRINFNDENNDNRIKFKLLSKILQIQVENHVFRYEIIVEECKKEFIGLEDIIEKIITEKAKSAYEKLTDEDIQSVSEFVEQRLSYLYLFEVKDDLKNLIQELEESDDIFEVNNKFERLIGKLNKSLQNAKAAKRDAASDFCIGGPKSNYNKNLPNMLQTTIKALNQQSNHIVTGIRGLNDMLGGGFENGRTYVIAAPPKSFKSGLLLNIGIWACKYNTFAPKDPDKIPCVLYVTMENTSKETIARLFTHITGDSIKNYSCEEANNIIQQYVEGDRKICFEIKYRKNKSISTTDLDNMVDELALEGKECVLIIQDYTKRIRSSINNSLDMRLELGEVVNDYCSNI